MLSQSIQGGIQCDQVFAWFCRLDVNEIDLFAFPLTDVFEPSFPASILNQNPPHGFGGSSKEMPRVFQCWILSASTDASNDVATTPVSVIRLMAIQARFPAIPETGSGMT